MQSVARTFRGRNYIFRFHGGAGEKGGRVVAAVGGKQIPRRTESRDRAVRKTLTAVMHVLFTFLRLSALQSAATRQETYPSTHLKGTVSKKKTGLLSLSLSLAPCLGIPHARARALTAT